MEPESPRSWLQYLHTEVTNKNTEYLMLACCVISGLSDSTIYNGTLLTLPDRLHTLMFPYRSIRNLCLHANRSVSPTTSTQTTPNIPQATPSSSASAAPTQEPRQNPTAGPNPSPQSSASPSAPSSSRVSPASSAPSSASPSPPPSSSKRSSSSSPPPLSRAGLSRGISMLSVGTLTGGRKRQLRC